MLVADALRGKTFIVTGGGTGLGKSMATRFAELGADVVLAARNVPRIEAAAAEMRDKTGAKILAVETNVRDSASCDAMVAKTVETFGKVDGLVNNAAGNFLAASEDLSSNAFDAVVSIVLKGSWNATQAAGKQMIAQGNGGSILSIVTTYAWTGSAFVLPSAMAKAGVLTMTRSLAVEWGSAYGIRLNAIAPGPFPTEGAWQALMPDPSAEEGAKRRIPLGRFGEHLELANLAAFLMSPYAGFINGDCITIDGGEWLKGAGEFSSFTDVDRGSLKQLFGDDAAEEPLTARGVTLRDRALDAGARVWSSAPPWMRRSVLRVANPRFMVGVVGLFRDDQGRVLLLRHRFRVPYPWGLPGGFLRKGEGFQAALARELREETGLVVVVRPAILDAELNDTGGYLSMTLGGSVSGATALRLSGEILDGGWFPPEALPAGMYPYHTALIERHGRS